MERLLIYNKKGQSLVELLMVIALAAILLPPIFMGYMSSREGKAQQKQRLLATSLMNETQEITRNIRDRGWNYIAQTGTYHPVVSGSTFNLASGPTDINGFTQQIVISDVYRDAGGVIVISPTPGILDPSTKKISTTISWSTPRLSSINHETYMTRFRDNITYLETTKSQFNNDPTHLSIFDKTAAVDTGGSSLPDDGEINMGLGGLGDWCNPNLTIAAFDLPKNGVANAISAIEGKVFTGTGDNASGVSFANVAISNEDPPKSTQTGTFDGYKTNGVFGENDYAYLATDNNSKEVVIIDLNNLDPITKKYSEIGYFNVPGNTNADSVTTFENIGFATSQNNLYTFDLSSKSGSRGAPLGSIALAGVGKKIVVKSVSGSIYAFIAVSSSSNQLQIVQVSSNGVNLSVIGQANLNAGNGVDVYINDTATRAYVATSYVVNKDELFTVDISTKSGDRPILGSYNTNGMNPKGVTAVTGNRVIVIGNSGEEYQVVNISTENSPIRCGGLNIDTGINGVASILESDNDAYSYIITGDATSELKIIEGGPGGSFGYNGTYTSAPFDSDGEFSHAFNRFVADVSVPTQTSLSIQVAVANAGANGCIDASYTFIGPNPSDYLNSYYQPNGSQIIGQIPLISYQNFNNPGRCFKYKAYLTTPDSSRTPALLNLTVNYSP